MVERCRLTSACASHGGTCVVLRDVHVDATATELDVKAWNGLGGGRVGYLYMSCGRESHVGEISQFLTFRSRIALVAIEGLVIFGIWCVLVCHCPHGCAAGLKLNKVAVRNENQTES